MQLVVLNRLVDRQLIARGRVIKQPDALEFLEACSLLQRAQQLQRGVEEARRKVLADAFAEGLAQGRAEANREYAQRLAEAAAAKQVALSELAPVIAELVADAVTAILGAQDRQRVLTDALLQSQSLVKKARWARLRVHPSDAEAAEAAIAHALPADRQIVTLVPDARLHPHVCLLETDVGVAEGTLLKHLTDLKAAVERAFAEPLPLAPAMEAVS
jgi:type III secretion protein L